MSNKEVVYDDIFDAFRQFAPSSWMLELEKDSFHPCVKNDTCKLLSMGDGYFTAFSGEPFGQLYRGENGKYETCEASIYRNHNNNGFYDKELILIDELKLIEFKNIVVTFPQAKMATKDLMKVDYLALAQHYELNTKLVDYTSEPEIAAYFATQRWENGTPHPITNGLGCIRGTMLPLLSSAEQTRDKLYSDRFHMIGLQCFRRPGLQSAYGMETDIGEDLSNRGWRVFFKQNTYF